MKNHRISFKRIAFTVLVSLASFTAVAGRPNTDLKIQLREVAEHDRNGYAVGTQTTANKLVAQSVSVKNGEKASLRLNVSTPMQWTQKIETQSSSATVSGITTQGSGAGITNALTWLDSGQSLTVTPRWPGGKQPVSIEIDIQTATVDERSGSELPNQTRSQLTTTINAVMGEWVTIARSGQRATTGSYSSSAITDAPQQIQIRVTVN